MREILFRGKRTDNGEWVCGWYAPLVCNDKTVIPYIRNENGTDKEVVPETVGQYTGLTDKNGKKIFEGDIIKQYYSKTINVEYDKWAWDIIDSDVIEGHHIGVVRIYTHNGVCLKNPISYNDIDGTNSKVNRIVNISGYRSEVIGNRWDNSELLEE